MKNGLVEKKIQVTRNGKTFTQTVWVKPDVVTTDVNPQVSELEELFKKDKTAGLAQLKALGVVWKENAHPAINLMRAKEAMKKHFGVTKPKEDTAKTPEQAKKQPTQGKNHDEYLKGLRDKGITWKESDHVAINVMRAKMAEKKFNATQVNPPRFIVNMRKDPIGTDAVLTSENLAWARNELDTLGLTLDVDDKYGKVRGYKVSKEGEILGEFKTYRDLDRFILNIESITDTTNVVPDPTSKVELPSDYKELAKKFATNCLGFEQGKDSKLREQIVMSLNSSVDFQGKLFTEKDLYIHLYKRGYEFRETSSGKARWYNSNTGESYNLTSDIAKNFSRHIYEAHSFSVLDNAFRGESFLGMTDEEKFNKVDSILSLNNEKADPTELREYCIGLGLEPSHTDELVRKFSVKFPSQFFKRCSKYSRAGFELALRKGLKDFDNARLSLAWESIKDEDMTAKVEKGIGVEGGCSLSSDVGTTIETTEVAEFTRLRLRASEKIDSYGSQFNMMGKVSTVYHETFHASANGRKTLFGSFEESLAELVANGLVKSLGFHDVERIAYVSSVYLTYNILKDEPEFSECESPEEMGLKLLQMIEDDDYDRTNIMKKFPKLSIHETLIKNGCGVNYDKANKQALKFLPTDLPMKMPEDFPEFIGKTQDMPNPKAWGESKIGILKDAWSNVVVDGKNFSTIEADCVFQYVFAKVGVKNDN